MPKTQTKASTPISNHIRTPAHAPHRYSPLRVALIFTGIGLAWIWLTDRALLWLSLQSEMWFLVAAGKGTLFVLFAALLVYWLVRREIRMVSRVMALLNAVVEETTDAIFVKDRLGNYLLLNAAGARLVGKPVEAVLGRDDTAIFDPADAQRVTEGDRRVMEAGVATTDEQALSIGGVLRTYFTTKAPYRDADGNVIGVVGISRDITDRKRAEQAVRDREVFARGVLDSVAAHIAVLEHDGTITVVNESWRAFAAENPSPHGPAPRIGVGTNYLDVCDQSAKEGCEDGASAAAGIRRVLAGEADRFNFEYPCDSPDESRWFLLTVTRLEHDAGGVVISHTNITDRKMAEAEVVRARAAAERNLAELRAVVTSLTDGVVVFDGTGTLIDSNPAAIRMHGHTSARESGRNYADFADAFDFSLPGGPPLPVEEWPISKLIRGEVVEDYELVFRRKDTGSERVIQYSGAAVSGSGGKQGLFVLTLHDVTERRKAEEAARIGERRLRELADAIPQIVWTSDPDGAITHLNVKAAEYSGMRNEDLTGWSWDRAVYPDDYARTIQEWTKVVRTGVPKDIEFRIRRADGEYRWHVSRQVPARRESGEIEMWYGTLTDIDDFKAAQAGLAAERTLLRTIIDAIPDLVFTKDSHRRFALCNRSLVEFSGVDAEADMVGKTVFDLFPLEHATAYDLDDLRVLQNGETILDREEPAVDGVGRLTWRLITKAPLRDAAGQVIGLVGVSRDITERKKHLQELATKEIQFRLFFQHVPAAVAMFDREMRYLYASSQWRAWHQLGDRDLTGMSHYDAFPQMPDSWRDIHRRCLAGATERCAEDSLVGADGTPQWIRWEVRPWPQADGEVGGIIIFSEDITERKLVTEALRDRERILSFVTASARVGLVVVSEQYEYLFANEAYGEVLGLDVSQILGRHVPEMLPAGWAQIQPRLDRALAGERVTYELNLSSDRWFRVWYEPRLDHAGRPTVVVVIVDVTEHKRADLAIRQSEARVRAVLHSLAEGVVFHDLAGRVVEANDSAERVFGHTFQELTDPDLDPRYRMIRADGTVFPPDEQPAMVALRTGLPVRDVEMGLRMPDNTVVWRSVNAQPVRSEDGILLGAVVSFFDITGRKSAEESLRRSEDRARHGEALLSAVMDSLPVSVMVADERGKLVRLNPASYHILGPAPNSEDVAGYAEYVGYWPDTGRLIEPHEWPMARAVLQGETTTAVRVAIERFDDRTLRHLELSAAPVVGDDGARLGGVVACHDVTDRVKAEVALRESEERYRRLVDVLPAAVLVHDGEQVLFCNPALARLLGAESGDEVVGVSAFDIVAPEFHQSIRQRLVKMRTTGRAESGIEMKVVRRDGRSVLVHSVTAPVPWYGPIAFLVALSDLTDRERSMELLRTVLGSVTDSIITITAHGVIVSANPATERAFGYPESAMVGQNVRMLMPEPFRREHDGYLANYLRTGNAKVIGIGREVDCLRRDGTLFPAELTVTEFQLDGEKHFTGVLRDITARKKLEAQFQQAQKMEAVGRLAGGVAHDFNNMLTVINGYSDLLLMQLPAGNKTRESLAAIRESGERASRLTQQLLAFSRKAVVEPRILDLNELIAELTKMIRRLIGEDILLAFIPDLSLPRVKADLGQLEQVMMNLAVNARDAMPTGGRLTIETRNVAFGPEDDQTAYPDLKSGRYARLTFTDTGVGMTEEVQRQIFEPFFTTKGAGKGTGLGLAVVHGVVKQSGGHIGVTSEVGTGTTFTILLPAVEAIVPSSGSASGQLAGQGSETILLVEDEDAVRAVARIALETQGYTVLTATYGEEAINLVENCADPIHLLVTDVVMPEMSGKQLAEAVRARVPRIKVLYMSGYTEDAVLVHGVDDPMDAFLQKPFTPLGLARKVRGLLDGVV